MVIGVGLKINSHVNQKNGYSIFVIRYRFQYSPRIEGGKAATLKSPAAGNRVRGLSWTVAIHIHRVPAYSHCFRLRLVKSWLVLQSLTTSGYGESQTVKVRSSKWRNFLVREPRCLQTTNRPGFWTLYSWRHLFISTTSGQRLVQMLTTSGQVRRTSSTRLINGELRRSQWWS